MGLFSIHISRFSANLHNQNGAKIYNKKLPTSSTYLGGDNTMRLTQLKEQMFLILQAARIRILELSEVFDLFQSIDIISKYFLSKQISFFFNTSKTDGCGHKF